MKQSMPRRHFDEVEIAEGLVIAPGVAVVEDEGLYSLLHMRSGCHIGPEHASPEQASFAFHQYLAEFDWTRSGGEIAYDLAVLMAMRLIHPDTQMTRLEPAYYVDLDTFNQQPSNQGDKQ